MEVKNLRDFQEFDEQRLSKKEVFTENKTKTFVLNFLPGQTLPSHNHPNKQVFLSVIEGKGVITVDGKEKKVSNKDVLYCHEDQTIGMENNGDDRFSVYVILAPK